MLGDGVLARGPDGGRTPNAGHLTLQFEVRHQGRTALLDDITGGGFTTLSDGTGPLEALDSEVRDFLAAIGATLVPLHPLPMSDAPDDGYGDGPGGYLAYLRGSGQVAAVARPDFYLYGTADDAAELSGLVRQLREQLREPLTTSASPR